MEQRLLCLFHLSLLALSFRILLMMKRLLCLFHLSLLAVAFGLWIHLLWFHLMKKSLPPSNNPPPRRTMTMRPSLPASAHCGENLLYSRQQV